MTAMYREDANMLTKGYITCLNIKPMKRKRLKPKKALNGIFT